MSSYPYWFIVASAVCGIAGMVTACFSIWMSNRLTIEWAVRYELMTSRYESIIKNQALIIDKLDKLSANGSVRQGLRAVT